ncbi:MAG: DUF2264 domain-containing protein [Acutalibacteraceae bacterium]|nr:DUF2264 domain-containing protein [Acutalibacteraceae bacterium]
MINSRKTLYETAEKMYISLLTRTAHRYYSDEPYVVSDNVGFSCTRIEEIFRPLWGLAPFLKDRDIPLSVDGKDITVSGFLTEVMCDGTNPKSPRCFDRNVTEFDKVVFANQSITEIAAYLVSAYFAPKYLWDSLSPSNRDQIALWIKKWAIFALRNSWPNNHYWYPIFCIEILKKLGYDCSEADSDLQKGYDFLETLYVGNGWYCDGAFGRFDYYEAWAHHTYPLLWILLTDLSDPENHKRAEIYKKRAEEFLPFFIHYFDSNGGMVAYGRSIGYRFGCVAPFGLAALTGCNIPLSQAKRVILKNIDYFFRESIPTKDGVFPCGYLYETTGFSECYTSDGAISCYTEGFMCLLAEENHPLWQAEEEPLPIEKGDYLLESPLEGMEIMISGENEKNGVSLYNNSLHYYQDEFFGHRFNDMAGYYSKFVYNSRSGFGISTADNVSSDNMISLYTPDGRMVSHRRKIEENRIKDGVMISTHTPFSNDKKTTVKTFMLPLKKGWHLRVHKVNLSQPYIICEGGFSVGIQDDNYTAEQNTVTYRNLRSEILVFSNTCAKYEIRQIHPGMHLLKPQALYPVYKTDVLPEGEYLFASLICFTSNGEKSPAPTIQTDENQITVTQDGYSKTILAE